MNMKITINRNLYQFAENTQIIFFAPTEEDRVIIETLFR